MTTPWDNIHLSSYYKTKYIQVKSQGRCLLWRKMTEGNLAEDEIQKTIKELFCSKKFTGEVHKVLSLLSVLNIFLSITAFLGNTLILVALHEETSLHAPSSSKLLYRNLAISDLCVGVILEPTAITYLLSVINEKWEICYYASVINHVAANLLCALSLYTVTAISRGQTSRLVAKAQIQTSYNFEKNLFKCDSYLDYVYFRHIILLLESFFHFMVGTYWHRPVSIRLSFFVHKNVLHSAPQSNSYSAPRFS